MSQLKLEAVLEYVHTEFVASQSKIAEQLDVKFSKRKQWTNPESAFYLTRFKKENS